MNMRSIYYSIIFNALLIIALVEFGATILYYLYIYQLQKIKKIKSLVTKLNGIVSKCYKKFKVKATPPPPIEPVGDYEQLQEELLLADPAQ